MVLASATSCPTRTEIAGDKDKGAEGKKARKARKAAARAAVERTAATARAAAEAVPGVPERAFAGEAVDAEPMPEPTDAPFAPLPPPSLAVRAVEGLARPASLCYGEPIREAGRTLVPVARVRVDGGGSIEAVPVAVLDVGPAGARFAALRGRPDGVMPALVAGLAGVAVGAAAGVLGRSRRLAPLRRRRRRR